ncbi:MAG: hypothetical protein NTW80_05360 [Deltaproteobacteria bacterium]|nr:hypothetical protein [Deltaproteobacteria bacterium]
MSKEGQDPDKARLAKLLKTLAAFPEVNPHPILIVDFTGRVTYSNGAANRMVKELGLAEPSAFLPRDLDKILAAAKQGPETWFYREVCLGRKIFGEDLHVDESLEILSIYGIDITEWKKSEIELKNYRGRLEVLVQQATETLREREDHFRAVVESAKVSTYNLLMLFSCQAYYPAGLQRPDQLRLYRGRSHGPAVGHFDP